MAGYPWSELGLDGPADERTVRRAYAARLKTVRPDVDAEGFQRLVQARDFALRAIENVALRRPVAPLTIVPKRAETPPPDAPHPDGSTEQPRARTEPPRPGTPQEAPPMDRSVPEGPETVTIDVNPDRLPPPGATEPESPSAGPGAGSPLSETDPQIVSALLSAFMTAWAKKAALPPVPPILRRLGELSIGARHSFEIEALRAVMILFDKGLLDRKARKSKLNAARALIIGFDDEYAWTRNDRRLHAMLPVHGAADQTARLLRVVREWERTGAAPSLATSRPRKSPRQLAATVGAVLVLVSFSRAWYFSSGSKAPGPNFNQLTTPPKISSAYAPALQPSSYQATASYNRGVGYDTAGEFDRAIEEYGRTIQLDPNFALAYYNRGLDYAAKGQFTRAIEDYSQAIRLNPRNSDIFVSRGVAYDGQGQYDRAIQDYDQAIQLSPAYVLAFVNRGIAYANKGQYDRAIRDYDQAIRLRPNEPDALFNRGQAKRVQGDVAGGDADIAKASQSR